MRRIFLSLFFLLWCAQLLTAGDRPGIAIVVDPVSQREAQKELSAYVDALEQVQNFKVYIVVDRFGVPDSIRAALRRLYFQKKSPIVGAILIGDIPVAMVRDAQYLTSAFKMNQSLPWEESSVPSDRFYDDFGLQFKYLKQDSLHSELYYYSLKAEGRQKFSRSIFSGRIRPTNTAQSTKYEKLRSYLRKATLAKRNPEIVTSVFVYTGSGSVNESKVAHMGEYASMSEHFPSLRILPNAFRYMDFSDERSIKPKFMNEMMKPDLSIALAHHHGDYDTQYLSRYPSPNDIKQAKEYLLHLYRSRLSAAARYKQNVDSVRRSLMQRDGLPNSWKSDLSDEMVKSCDSMDNATANLVLNDFAAFGYRPNSRVVMLDACYNASFHRDDCIANEYIFQEGRTLCAIGGSVNVIQDKWPDRYWGLLEQGVPIGYLHRLCSDLELHIVGDPTFAFQPTASASKNLNELFVTPSPKAWKTLLQKSPYADVCAMAVRQLSDAKLLSKEELIVLLRTSSFAMVRMEAFLSLMQSDNDTRVEAMNIACRDNFELLQRFAINAMVKSGDPRILDNYVRVLCDNNTSARVSFNALQGTQFFPKDLLLSTFDKETAHISPYMVDASERIATLRKRVESYAGRWSDDIQDLCAGKLSPKRARMQISFMKIYVPPYLIPDIVNYASTLQDASLLVPLLDALGWHTTAYTANSIKQLALQLSKDTSQTAEVRAEALKTYKRINHE